MYLIYIGIQIAKHDKTGIEVNRYTFVSVF